MTIPARMCAVLLTGHGGLDKLEYRTDVPVPAPAAREVLIAVRACGINNTDIWVREGAYGTDDDPPAIASWRRGHESTLRFPRVQGADTVGVIVATGEGVAASRIGQRVRRGRVGVALDLRTVYLKHLELHGSSQGTRGAFRALLGYIGTEKIRPLLHATYRLSEILSCENGIRRQASCR